MQIDWDQFPGDAKPQHQPRECLPAGFHFGKVELVEEKAGWRITERNPSGHCLSIWVDVDHGGQRHRVFASVATNWVAKLSEVAASAGVPGPVRGEPVWDEQQLVGTRVYVETGTYEAKSGRDAGATKPSIIQWVPVERQPRDTETTQERRQRHDPEEVTAPRARRATAAQKITARVAEDDIPF
jgi:hypothetical protein